MARETRLPLTASTLLRDAVSLWALATMGCASSVVVPPPPRAEPAPRSATTKSVTVTVSPQDDGYASMDARERSLSSRCGRPDVGLFRVARAIATERAGGSPLPEADVLASALRVQGVPHLAPELLAASSDGPLDVTAVAKRLASFGRHLPQDDTRCAVAIARAPSGSETAVAVAVRALADMDPLPRQARSGQWLRFSARPRIPVRAAELVILGPSGRPRSIALPLADHEASASFALEQPGAYLVQMVAETDGGPRPLLEAELHTDEEPRASSAPRPAPGEDDGNAGPDDLRRMVQAMREASGVPALEADAHLDALAAAHAAHMLRAKKVAHDLGDGDLRERFRPQARDARALAENVAHASSLRLAHRALYGSASHRINLINAIYTHVGIGVARDDDGSVYVCEIFATYD